VTLPGHKYAGGSQLNTSPIREYMSLVGSCSRNVGYVDAVEGGSIRLSRSSLGSGGRYHFILLRWVDGVDQFVRLDRNCDEVQRQWQATSAGAAARLQRP
jgi:hypothetical protein